MATVTSSSLPDGSVFKVASAQISPVYFDKQKSLDVALGAIEDAARQGCRLIVFAELFLPGYPFYIWLKPYIECLPYIETYFANSCEVDGPEAAALKDICKRLQIRVVIGVSERDHTSLYMSQWIISPTGDLISRRKVRPTSLERTVFGEGDGSDLKVMDTELGRFGALQCWEHSQPIFRHVMGAQHQQIHAASWPCFPPTLPHFSLSAEANYAFSQTYAIETGSFTLAASQPMTQENQDVIIGEAEDLRKAMPLGGGMTQIFDPEGRPLCKRPADDEQCLIIAEVDLRKGTVARSILDPTGHYGRPDIFKVTFDNRPRQHVLPHAHAGIQAGDRMGARKTGRELFQVANVDTDSLA